MRYGQIRKMDIANGSGIRTSIFVTGCTHHCFNCFNEEYQDFGAGKEWTDEETELVLSYVKDPNVSGLTLLGGEPMQNVEGLLDVVVKVREAVPEKTIWLYSGYTFDALKELAAPSKEKALELLSYCDVLVDGPYVDEQRDPSLVFRGSKNQRILDVKKSLSQGEAVWCEGFSPEK